MAALTSKQQAPAMICAQVHMTLLTMSLLHS